jgi:hypothetical protein
MPHDREPSRPAWPRLVLRRADQAVAAAVIAVSLAGLGGYGVWQGSIRGRLIEIERAEPIAIDTRIDINTADWPERSTGNLFGTGRPRVIAPIA